MTYIIYFSYFILINIAGYFLVWLDKRRMLKKKRRIPQESIFSTALFFGSLGVIMGMRQFNHLRDKPKFTVAVPIMFYVQLVIIIVFVLV